MTPPWPLDWPPEQEPAPGSEGAAPVEQDEDHGRARQGDQGQGRKVGDQVEIHRDQVESRSLEVGPGTDAVTPISCDGLSCCW